MTKEEYIALVEGFGLEFRLGGFSAYFGLYPVCGWRVDGSNFTSNNWEPCSLIIYDSIEEEIKYNGKYSGKYKSGLYATDVEEGKRLVYNRIKELKDLMVRNKIIEMNKDFA